jgi:cysteine desulfurase
VANAVALATAMELTLAERDVETARLTTLRDAFESRVLAAIPDVVIHGREAPRSPHVSCLSIPGTDAETMLMALDMAGIAASGGSACQSGSVGASHVLSAMGVPPDLANAQLRLSFGALTTPACIDRVATLLPQLAEKARATSAF